MHATVLFIHLVAASIWVGGHLVLAVSLLPEALSKRDPDLVLGFERIYERIGLPAMAVQVATGLWLARISHRCESSWRFCRLRGFRDRGSGFWPRSAESGSCA